MSRLTKLFASLESIEDSDIENVDTDVNVEADNVDEDTVVEPSEPVTEIEEEIGNAEGVESEEDVLEAPEEPVETPEGEVLDQVDPEVKDVIEATVAESEEDVVATVEPQVDPEELKDQQEVEELEDELETVEEATATLEAYHELLKQAGSNGISAQSAAFLNIGLNKAYKDLGLETFSTGLEDFTTCNSSDAIKRVTISAESVGEKAKEGLKKAWEYILKLIEKAAEWYNGLFDSSVKVKKQVEEALGNVKSANPLENEEVDLPGKVGHKLQTVVGTDKGVKIKPISSCPEQALAVNLGGFYIETLEVVFKASKLSEEEGKKLEDSLYDTLYSKAGTANLKDSMSNGWSVALVKSENHPEEFEQGQLVLINDKSENKDNYKILIRNRHEIENDLKSCLFILNELASVNDKLNNFKKTLAEINTDNQEENTMLIKKMARCINNPVNKTLIKEIVSIVNARVAVANAEMKSGKKE